MKFQWHNTAIIIGLIGGCISIPKSAIEAWQVIFSRPKLAVYPGQQVTLAYQPGSHLLTCSFAIVLTNAGNKAEVIHTLRAHLGMPDDPLKLVPFTGNDILLRESQNEIPQVLPVEQNTSRTLVCEIKATLSEPLGSDHIHELLTEDKTSRELVLELTGEKKSYRASFHFDFGAAASARVFVDAKEITLLSTDL
jgi:hypothetical protein